MGGETYLEAVVCPATELKDASLFIEGEVFDVDLTGRLVDGRWFPLNEALVVDGSFGCQCHFEVTIGAGKWNGNKHGAGRDVTDWGGLGGAKIYAAVLSGAHSHIAHF